MIYIKNTQRKVKINIEKVKNDIQKILDIINYPDFDINVWFTTNKTIQKFNKQFRNKDKPTDILSFAYHDLNSNETIKPILEEDKNLGDLIISVEYVQKDAQINWNQSFEQRLQTLLVHGICHLLGYDHIKDEDYETMQKKEKSILQKLNNNLT